MTPQDLRAAGWTSARGHGFTDTLGELWLRGAVGERQLGFISTLQHSNNDPVTVHGGALMTFADIALGYRAAESIGGAPCVTAQLQLQFVAGARVGEFICCDAELVRRTSALIFVRGLIRAGDRVVASADGIWKIRDPGREPRHHAPPHS